jgi:hypothetical protein
MEREYTANPFFPLELGTVRSFADTTRFHLRSAGEIARVLFEGQPFPDEQLATTLEELEKGIPAPLLGLARELPILTREEVLAFGRTGATSATALGNMADEELLPILRQPTRVALLRKALGGASTPVAA